ncbi:MAG: enoyl-CoA hydratase/isomerase family protein [Acidobacteriota bacterium]|jgi:enoyl-CoA hydratase/carnithine racemase|nr:enoyl-CoA hydratase/isomerase family protein [Acidobacteriota bacterium]
MDRSVNGTGAVGIERLRGVTVLEFESPILSLDVLDGLSSTLESLAVKDAPDPLVICSAHQSVFLAGAHLAEIADLDASSSGPYARRGRRAIRNLENHRAPVVCAINGTCSGGGFDLALTCDALIVGPGARFSHPGVRRGLVTGWSGTTRLPSALGSAAARAALLETRELDPTTLSFCGAILRTAENPLAAATEKARQMASLDPMRWSMWRGLRGPGFIDRFHAFVVHKL